MTKRSIIIVDDEECMLNILKFYLKDHYEVTTVENPSEVLELYKKNKYDLILTDFYMPEMEGPKLAQLLKEFDPECKVILMSGSHIADFEKFHFSGFLKKPFSQELMLNTLNKI